VKEWSYFAAVPKLPNWQTDASTAPALASATAEIAYSVARFS
jgi:hypothetical protein